MTEVIDKAKPPPTWWSTGAFELDNAGVMRLSVLLGLSRCGMCGWR
jgi:hypothetical protein